MAKKSKNGASDPRSVSPSQLVEQGDAGAPRFKPRGEAAPSTSLVGALEPGAIEVEFEEGVKPVIAGADAGEAFRSPSGADLSMVNEVARRHQLVRAEPSIQAAPDPAAPSLAFSPGKRDEAPYAQKFMTLHFAAAANLEAICEELEELPEVRRAVPVPKAIPPQTPLNEPLVGVTDQVVVDPISGLENQWYVFRCRGNQAWNGLSGNGVVIADIDWGYRTTHQDLAARLDLGRAYNSFDGSNNVSHGASISHGTAVLGIAGGDDNDRGMAGFAHGATLWPIQANSGPGPALGGNSWATAIEWVRTADSGGRRKVIILEVQTGSFGNYEMVPSVNAAIRAAIASGVVVCVAAGNGDRDAGIDDIGNPIQETGSILVGATGYHPTENRRAWFSNWGPRIVVSAPGDGDHDVTCDSTADDAYRNRFGGTSGATPKVAGTVALLLEANPDLTHEEIREILRETGTAVNSEAGKPVGVFLDTEGAVSRARRVAQPLYRYWNGTVGDHFYTTDWSELGNGAYGWVFDKVECYVHEEPRPGTVPLYRYWNPRVTDHFYTTNFGELGHGRYGYIYEGVECYVYAAAGTGAAALHRYWNPEIGDHFYTTDWNELGSGAHGWHYEGIQCHVRTTPAATAVGLPELAARQASRVPETFRIAATNGRDSVPDTFRPSEAPAFHRTHGFTSGIPYQDKPDSFRARANGGRRERGVSLETSRDTESGELTLTLRM